MYSYVTDAGRAARTRKIDRPTRYALGSGGYREWGGIRAGEKPLLLAQIDPLVRAALQINDHVGLRFGETPDIVILFYWGCMRPEVSGVSTGKFDSVLNLHDMLDLVGGRALIEKKDRFLRAALVEAALEDRYFLIVSAYDPVAFAREAKVLLWRTQISVASPGISQEEAFPVLASCGATEFGRGTPAPRFIDIDVAKATRRALAQ